ncbi:MAG: T9SS type A sorting domain-containing protein [Bacteroidia bacterium]|nr:T9SS type A sorting domain-containing protein [Bacteroidia bacterium]
MKKFLLLLTLFSSFFTNVAISQIDLILTTPANVGACQINSYVGQYLGTGVAQDLSIASTIINNDTLTCGISNGSLVIVDSIKNQNGATITPSQTFTDSTNGSWSATLPIVLISDTVFIYYHIIIDCSVIPTGSSIPSLQLVQTWTDSSNTFEINSSGNTDTSNTIKYPLLVNLSPPSYTMGYKDTIELAFIFANSGTADANINISFTPDLTQYCGAIDNIDYYYKVGILGTPTSFIPTDSFSVSIPINDSLFIIQKVVSISCFGGLCEPNAEFKWRCQLDSIYESSFCDSCYGSKELNYSIQNAISPVLHIDRLLPVSDYEANFDTSCVNQDTSLLREWKFKIYVTGDGLLDSAFVHFHNSNPTGFNTLSLIPFSSIEIDTFFNSGGCYLDTAYFINPNALCSTAITDPLGFLNLTPHNFGKNDSIILSFKTYRCVEEVDTLFNLPKYFNTWKFEGSFSRSICHDNIIPTYNPSYAKYNITDHVGANVFQNLYFAPTITDLSASNEKATPIDSLWGDSAHFEIELKGYLWETMDNQLFGCYKDSLNGCIPEGYLRITIDTETGLAPSMLDSMVQLRYLDSLGSEVLISPEYYYTNIPDDSCKKGITNLYYKLSSPGVITALKTGFFDFTLKSCCGGQNGGVPYAVKFYFLLDPSGDCLNLTYPVSEHDTIPVCDGGDGCAWLPLSSVEDDIVVHCPGCVTPGIVVSNYSIYRSSFGLQDSDNDGKADDSLTQIEKGTTWFNQNRSKLKTSYAGVGDKLEDRLSAYFGAGDPFADGYNYPMMVSQNADLNYLQLSRKIPLGNSLMDITVDTIVIYIDTPDNTQTELCIECVEYGISPTQFSTQRKLIISGASVNNYLYTVGDYYLFTFSSWDSAGSWIGNLHNSTFTTDSSINHPLHGFFENQRYRIRINYSICGNFMMANNDIKTEVEDVRKESEIKNTMWLSGSPKPANPFDSSFFAQPASDTLLHLEGWSFPPDTIGSEVDSLFADEYLFICEDFGGKLYFFSHDGRNNSSVGDQQLDCIKSIHISSESRVGGGLLKVYPYEYRPATFQASEYRVIVPPNYYISSSYVSNTINLNDSMTSDIIYFSVIDTTGTVSIYDSLFSCMPCLTDSSITDTNLLYFGSSYTSRAIYLELKPFNCIDSLLIKETDSIVKIIFTTNRNTCIDISSCAQALSDTVWTLPYEDVNFTINPNDTISYIKNVTGLENKICFPFSLSNPSITGSTYAPNYFLYMPSLNDVPFLSGWTLLNTTTGILVPMVDSVFQIDSVLEANEPSGNYELCANFISCPNNDSNELKLQFGWHCDGYPSKSDSDTVCGSTFITLNIITDSTRVNELGKILVPRDIITYSLCAPFTYKKCFKSVDRGAVSPISFLIETPDAWLNFVSFYVSRDSCPNNSIPVLLQPDSIGSNTFSIPDSALTLLGYQDSLLHFQDCLCGAITFQSECDTAGGYLPNIQLSGESYCGDTISIQVLTLYEAVWDSTSACHDCFTLKKTASSSTISEYDTMSFNIIICSTNTGQDTVTLTETLPANFVLTSAIPSFVIMDSISCDTIVVEGYFTQPGICLTNTNIVQINYSNFDSLNQNTFIEDSLLASACIDVSIACVDPNTISIKDGSYSHNYSSTYSNTSFYIKGLFTIDSNLTLNNCTVFMAAGAQIIIVSNVMFSLDSNTNIIGCDTMWQGILMEPGAGIEVFNGSKINDANRAIQIDDECELYLTNAQFYDNIVGVYSESRNGDSYRFQAFSVTGTTFDFNGSLRPDYVGQPIHGSIPNAGINLTDVSIEGIEIGKYGAGMNSFQNMNFGVKGLRCDINILNSQFSNIVAPDDSIYKIVGTAIYMEGDLQQSIPSNLRVLPVGSGVNTISNCERGVFASYSDMVVSNCKIMDVNTGVECTQNHYLRSALVTECTINARKYGISYYGNTGAKNVIATFNSISINGSDIGIGISVIEPSIGLNTIYDFSYNYPITMTNAHAGIYLSKIYKPKVSCNKITLKQGFGNAKLNAGIIVNDCLGAQLNNNIAKGYSEFYTKNIGVLCNASTNTSLYCNLVDSSGYGFYFGGICPGTQLKGNSMIHHYQGLHLNSAAVIGLQTHNGNKWYNPDTSKYDAVNFNWKQQSQLLFSLLTINPSLPQIYQPKIPLDSTIFPFVYNSDWMKLDSGFTYNCPNVNTCIAIATSFEPNDVWLLQMIALDSALTVDYIEESQAIAQNYLYDRLMIDSTLRYSNISFQTFLANQTSLGNLYQANLRLSHCRTSDDSSAVLLLTLDSMISIYKDSLSYYLDQDILLAGVLENINIQLNFLKAEYVSLIQAMRNRENEILLEAGFYNSQVYSTELPFLNQTFINNMDILYQNYGLDSIVQHKESILFIAHQCPYQGGNAVYSARFYSFLFNDSIEYDDMDICLQQGIYRIGHDESIIEKTINLELHPNPANEYVEIKVVGLKPSKINISIYDLEGRILSTYSNVNSEGFKLDVSHFKNGIYLVCVDGNEKVQFKGKLAVVR